MSELKNCPFCGGEAKRNDDLQNWGDIFCSGCGCHMAEGNMEKAIKAWNTRPDLKAKLVKMFDATYDAMRDFKSFRHWADDLDDDQLEYIKQKAINTIMGDTE